MYLKGIPIVFNNVSKYDNHFIIKELTEEFKKTIHPPGNKTS